MCVTPQSPMPSNLPSGTHIRPGRVLVVDDEPFLAELLRRTLSDENEIVVATEAVRALARLEAGERFDVVLCELMMSTMDGIELHRQLSLSLPREANRIVFVTGGAITTRVESFFRGVPNLLLERPIDVDGLRALIERRARGGTVDAPSARVA